MVVTVMDSTLWYRPGDDGLKAPAVVTTLPARSWLKKLSLWREGRAHVSYCLLTRQGQGCGRLPWHTSSRWVGAAARRLRFHLLRASDCSLWWCWLCEDLARAQRADKVDDAMPVGGCTGGGMGLQ